MSLLNSVLKIGSIEFEKPNAIDKLLDKFFLFIFPGFITPNHLTLFRYLTIPFIFYFLAYEHYFFGLLLFMISSFSDALDGAMARTRGQITSWGKINDPLADKLLIGLTGMIVISKYIGLWFIFTIIILEILTVLVILSIYDKKDNPGARLPGKIKMILQSFGIVILLVYSVKNIPIILFIATALLVLSIVFSVVNLLFCIFISKSI